MEINNNMDGWKYWDGKKVYIILKNKRIYSGKIIEVNESSNNLIFLTIIDKFNCRITVCNSEIYLIQEERE